LQQPRLKRQTTSPAPLAETRLGELSAPTLVIVGDLDDPEFVAHADTVAAAIPGAEKVVIAGAGHMSVMEKPDEANRALEAFLAKGRLAGSSDSRHARSTRVSDGLVRARQIWRFAGILAALVSRIGSQ
jgi:hypothetical protein